MCVCVCVPCVLVWCVSPVFGDRRNGNISLEVADEEKSTDTDGT